MKLTKKRQAILDILENEKTPLSAEEIAGKLQSIEMNLSTIYRSLEFLYTNQLIAKSMINHTAFYHSNHHHRHYIICSNCHKMVEIDCHIEHLISDIEDKSHFKVTHHDLTFYGLCDSCKSMS